MDNPEYMKNPLYALFSHNPNKEIEFHFLTFIGPEDRPNLPTEKIGDVIFVVGEQIESTVFGEERYFISELDVTIEQSVFSYMLFIKRY